MIDKCPKCGGPLRCLAGESAHPSNWFCEDEKGCGWQAWDGEPGWLRRQIQQAEEGVRKLKRHSPYIFPEWQELQQAKADMQKAEVRYAAAKKQWKDLGSNSELSRMLDLKDQQCS